MESQGAKIIPWNSKAAQEKAETTPQAAAAAPRLAPIDDIVIVLSDERLEALAALFCMNPARKAMTFEAYLTVKGYAREVSA